MPGGGASATRLPNAMGRVSWQLMKLGDAGAIHPARPARNPARFLVRRLTAPDEPDSPGRTHRTIPALFKKGGA